MRPKMSEPRMNPPNERSVEMRRRSASLLSAGESIRLNVFQRASPSSNIRNAMMRTSTRSSTIVAVAVTAPRASEANVPASSASRPGSAS